MRDVLAFDERRLFSHEADARAAVLDGAHRRASPKRGDGFIHAFDEGGVGEAVAVGEVDDFDLRATRHEGAEVRAKLLDGVERFIPLGAAGCGVGHAADAGHAVALAVDEPVAEGEVLEEVGHAGRLHEAIARGDEPLAVAQALAFQGGVVGQETQCAGAVFKEPQRDEAEARAERRLGAGPGAPDDFVDGVTLADGVHHLADEQAHAAAFVLVDCAHGFDVLVEVFERSFVTQSLRRVVLGNDVPAEASGRLLAFGGDGFDDVVALLDDFPQAGGLGERSGVKRVELPGEALGREIADGIERRAPGATQAVRMDGGGCFHGRFGFRN